MRQVFIIGFIVAVVVLVNDGQAAPAKESAKVLLGSPGLTEGIPGSGALSAKEIQAWLSDAKNHASLDIELPPGLASGASQIKGIDANPMTRAKIELGRQLYFDRRLSSDGTVSCADCHHPDEGYGRHTPFGIGVKGQQGGRNSPVSYNRILSGPQFWDGRAASLEEQAKGPIANPIEMANTHEACIECLKGIEGYRLQFAKIFGGEIDIEKVAQAIATFERALVTGPSPYDYHDKVRSMKESLGQDLETLEEDDPEVFALYQAAVKASEAHPMSDEAKRGRDLFFGKAKCSTCHVGANLADEKYHNLGVGMDKPMPDLGRYEVTKLDSDKGAFKTPTIRNVTTSAPYMHDGSQKTLEEVVEWYDKGGHKNPWLSKEITPLKLTPQEKMDLVEFMKACEGPFPKVETGRLPE